MNSRFDYVQYDETAMLTQEVFKTTVINLERTINDLGRSFIDWSGPTPINEEQHRSLLRSKGVALTKLEEFYMWAGKAVRDEQIIRKRSAPLQEERKKKKKTKQK